MQYDITRAYELFESNPETEIMGILDNYGLNDLSKSDQVVNAMIRAKRNEGSSIAKVIGRVFFTPEELDDGLTRLMGMGPTLIQ